MAKNLSVYYRTQAKPHPVTLYVRPQAKTKMDAYVRLVDEEVGWMGFIKTYERHDEDHNITVPGLLVLEDVFLYEQEVSSGSVDADGVDASAVLQELVDEDKADRINELRFFAHSHANMGVYHSGTDTGMIDDWAATGLDWFISHVQNKKGEVDARLDIFLPFRVSCPVEEKVVVDQELEELVLKEIEAKVSVKKYHTQWTGWSKGSKNGKGSSKTVHPNEGNIISDERKEQIKNASTRGRKNAGTVERPLIQHRTMNLHADGTEVQVRQEVVEGVIIHESITGSPAAKARNEMTIGERYAYYKEYMSANPTLTDPTPEQLEEHSRSLQRSETKKETSETPSLSPGTSQEKTEVEGTKTPGKAEGKDQTQDQKTHKRSSGKDKKENKGSSSPDSSEEKKKKQLVTETELETLSVKEETESKEETSSLEDDVEDAFKNMGLAI